MRQSGGILTVRLQDVTLTQNDIVHQFEVSPGDFIKISVEDTGIGMTNDVKEKAFDPFFTTKELGEGTGMGLSTVHGIIAELGGFITLYSEPNQGTAIHLFIPRLTESDVIAYEQIDKPTKGGVERILFVDDEQIQIELAEEALSLYGYQVTTFSDSTAAWLHFKQAPAAYDMIITDVTMPKMTGDILSQKIRSIRPDLPIIMCTGFSEIMDEKKAKTLEINAYLFKPVVITDLLKTIRTVFDK